MKIGINATAAFTKPRTGVEEYTYQLIKHLAMLEESKKHRFVLYNNQTPKIKLPENFELKRLKWPLPMWTQLRLAGEMILKKPEVLFIPVHALPLIHPQNSVTTIHGLEYEYYPEMYPKKHLAYLKLATRYASKKSKKIIVPSESTKKDLIKFYQTDPNKIKVIHHGVKVPKMKKRERKPEILFIGRLEKKKNIEGLVQAFKLLKKKYQLPHKLILAGSKGYGYKKVEENDIIEKGYISQKEKWQLISQAEVFVLPSFYEGFGIPVLEAQAIGTPVITSNISSMPEISGEGAILIDPNNIEQICSMLYKIIDDQELKERLIKKGEENARKFTWQKCAQKTLKILEG